MKKAVSVLFYLLMVFVVSSRAETITVAAAGNLAAVMPKLAAAFSTAYPEDKVEVVLGASGKLLSQISAGAPFDIFLAADIEYPEKAVQSGYAVAPVLVYASGKLALWSADPALLTRPDSLKNGAVKKISLPNPKLAPYGEAAVEWMNKTGIYKDVSGKLVYTENLMQSASQAVSRVAEVAFLSVSQLSAESLRGGSVYMIPPSMHSPLKQGAVVTKQGAEKAVSKRFMQFLKGREAAELFRQAGYTTGG